MLLFEVHEIVTVTEAFVLAWKRFVNIYSDNLSVWLHRPVVSVFPVVATHGPQVLYDCSQN